MVKIQFSEKVTDTLKRKQVVGVEGYSVSEMDWAMKSGSGVNKYEKKINFNAESYDHEQVNTLPNYASFDEERRCEYNRAASFDTSNSRSGVYPNQYSPIQVSSTSNSLISPRVKLRRKNSILVTPDRRNNNVEYEGYSEYNINHSLSYPLCNGVSYINHSMSYESAGAPLEAPYFNAQEYLPPPPSCPFSPSSKSCFQPVQVQVQPRKPTLSMQAADAGVGQAIFRRQTSIAMSDTSWNDLAKVNSVDEDDISCHSLMNDNETREDNLNSFYNNEQPIPAQLSMSFSMDHDHSSIMPLPLHNNNHNESIEEAFTCPVSPKKKKEITVSVLTTSSQDCDEKAINNAVFNWSKEDDEKLIILMKRRRGPVKDWNAIARDHGRNKTDKECSERWVRYLKPGVKKGQWKPCEDAIVLNAVTSSSEKPFTKWSDLAQKLPGRAGKQIRDRWVNYLNPAIHHLPFTRDDDILLYKGHAALGKRWAEISLKFFNGSRSENQIKNRWYSASFKKFIMKEYGSDAHDSATAKSSKSSPVAS